MTGGAQAAEHHDVLERNPWPDTALSRLEALALLQTLNSELLSNASATLTLDRWCMTHKLAPVGEKIVAQRVKGQDAPADATIRHLLAAAPDEPIVHRRVRLACGVRILSEADNWYLPSRLTPEMNQALDSSDVAFGRAVQALNFSRKTISANLLWAPLTPGWEMASISPPLPATKLELPHFLIEHHAVLNLPGGSPFSALIERYTADVLDFPAPQIP
ncbi:hypothetical protein GFL49_36170 [Rhizobium leguminosarum bv. viciae]|nr:hypothetical protein [Rhizobium leguminosarum bv. viciae]